MLHRLYLDTARFWNLNANKYTHYEANHSKFKFCFKCCFKQNKNYVECWTI